MGPLQRKVLRVLLTAKMSGVRGMSAEEISEAINYAWGHNTTYAAGVNAALSGMTPHGKRKWTQYHPHPGGRGWGDTLWTITARGIDALTEGAFANLRGKR